MADDKREKAKVLLADRLRTLQAAEFLDFEDIVRHLQGGDSLARTIVNLAKVVGFDSVYGDLYARAVFKDNGKGIVQTWKKALLNEVSLVEELLRNIPNDEIPLLFKFWLTETRERATWEQLVNATPYAILRACASEGDKRADEAAADAEVVDEEVMEIGEPSDDGK